MEVAAGEDVSVVREDQRVIRNSVDLRFDDLSGVVIRHAARTVDLRQTAQRVGVLNTDRALMYSELAAGKDLAEVGCCVDLSAVGTNFLDSRVIRIDDALKRIDGQHRGDVGGLDRHTCIVDGKAGNAGHRAGAVDESEALLRL